MDVAHGYLGLAGGLLLLLGRAERALPDVDAHAERREHGADGRRQGDELALDVFTCKFSLHVLHVMLHVIHVTNFGLHCQM